MNRAFIFPGQGSQSVGMGKDLYENFPGVKSVFQEVDDTLNYSLSKIIFEGPMEDLTLTSNTQPALMTVSIALFREIIYQSGKKINDLSSYVAGHSLGEYSALCAADSISLADTARILKIRGTSMQEACPAGIGGMAACIAIEKEQLQEYIDLVNSKGDGQCQIANDNVEGQIVTSGHKSAIDQILELSKEKGFKAIALKVSAPFHSELIKGSIGPMQAALDNIEISTPKVPLIANVTADIETNEIKIKENLIKQICGNVRWRETMHKLKILGIDEVVEVGAGNVLSNFAKRAPIEWRVRTISNIKDLEVFLNEL